VTAPDGTVLHAELFGPRDAPTIVLIHGWTEAIRFWIYEIAELSKEFRVVAYDLRGHGRSAPAAGNDYSLARLGDDLEAVLAACVPDGQRAVVVGHSLGAMSIAAWAERHDVEARARAAMLLNTGLGGLLAGHMLIRLPAIAAEPLGRRLFLGNATRIPRFSSPLKTAIIRYVACAPAASPAAIAHFEQMVNECRPDVRALVGLAMADMELHGALARLTVPTRVVAGELDRLTPVAHAQKIAGLLPNLVDLVVLPDTGHLGPLERPREINAAIRELAGSAVGSAPVVA
jgi:pimeloyl-ACP methyl ester carboxylesterase